MPTPRNARAEREAAEAKYRAELQQEEQNSQNDN